MVNDHIFRADVKLLKCLHGLPQALIAPRLFLFGPSAQP